MSNRTLRILANARKRFIIECSDSVESKSQRSNLQSSETLNNVQCKEIHDLNQKPDYSLISDGEFDDDIGDPTYIPSDADEEEVHNNPFNNGLNYSGVSLIANENVEKLQNNAEIGSDNDTFTVVTKRKRTTESQMLHKEKHPLRNPCHCKIKCYEKFKDNERFVIHTEYWSVNRHTQRTWMSSKVKEFRSKRTKRDSRRDITRHYFLPQQAENGDSHLVQVCQKFFLATLGYNNPNVLTTLSKAMKDPAGNLKLTPTEDKRGRHTPANKKDRNLITTHINSFNPVHAHYTRNHAPNRKYLPPDLTIKFMHKDYCMSFPDNKVCYEVYRKCLDNMNISFYEATPEICGYCQEMDLNATEENKKAKEEHLAKVKMSRALYKANANIKDESVKVFATDLQKIVLLPRMPNVKEAFFISRLITFNQTFASMQTHNNHILLLWHEAIAARKAENIASTFIKCFLLNRDAETIIIWMDNCTSQNKNFSLYSAIITYINSKFNSSTNSIILRYLVKGHTFMAADGLHGRIEQEMRRMKNVYDSDDFINCCQRSSNRTNVITMEPKDFFKFENQLRARKTKDVDETLPYFKDITEAKFTKGKTDFEYKKNFDEEYRCTQNALKKKAKIAFPDHGMEKPRGISETKKTVIVNELVPKMKQNRTKFWLELPCNAVSEDLLNEGL